MSMCAALTPIGGLKLEAGSYKQLDATEADRLDRSPGQGTVPLYHTPYNFVHLGVVVAAGTKNYNSLI